MNGDRVSNKDLYEAVSSLEEKLEERFVKKGEFKAWLVAGLVGGQSIASLVTAYVTHLSPPEQVGVVYHLFF